jgi:hypothetical protein
MSFTRMSGEGSTRHEHLGLCRRREWGPDEKGSSGTGAETAGRHDALAGANAALHKRAFCACKNEFADRTSLRSSLLFQPPVEGGRDVYGCENGFLLHTVSAPYTP